jgi:predicted patatin/cPLA2 family phospholipase
MKTSINIRLIKQIGIGIASLVALYFLILLLTRKPQIPSEVKVELKALQHLTDSLQQNQKKYDTLIADQETVISDLDLRVKNIKEKTTIIREYYHIQSQAADKYTSPQIDSFLKSRYNY